MAQVTLLGGSAALSDAMLPAIRKHEPAKACLTAIYTAPTRAEALAAATAFAADFAAFPKATARLTNHLDALLAFYDFPVEHHVHLRSTNPIESTFSTVR